MKNNLLLIALSFSFLYTNAQDTTERTNKGRIYASYGLSRTTYDLSTLKMSGDGYDFSLTHFDANDGFSEYDFAKFNGKIGYFFSEHFSIALGFDNFSYKAIDKRLVKIGGVISDTTGGYEAEYQSNEDVIRTNSDFITFEYFKLNYINLNLEVHDNFWVSKNTKFAWSYYFGLGAGIVITESTVSLFGQDAVTKNNGMNGFGANASFGTKFYLGPVYLDLGGKAGYIKTKDVSTGGIGTADHNFMFTSGIASIGVSFNLSK
ncbi:MAG: hypothetical protein QMC21_00435 [Flavobacteriales bacterium]|jgi:hypothetical protein|tara:strand:+ start:96 stop:881 length:786 start_codon:yes stop_codon:yes gene_type:complete